MQNNRFTLDDYNKQFKKMSYNEYINYLLSKYGPVTHRYFTWGFGSKVPDKMAKEKGLFIHHIKEDIAPRLSNIKSAMMYPEDWQAPEELVYCNYLEHLYLHILITEEHADNPTLSHNGVIFISRDVISYITNTNVPRISPTYYGAIKDDASLFRELMNRYLRVNSNNWLVRSEPTLLAYMNLA